MSEVANNVTRIYPEGAPESSYVFTTDTIPPRFAVVDRSESGYWGASGPLTEQQLAEEVTDSGVGPLSSEGLSVVHDVTAIEYSVQADDIGVSGDYPGGHERAALNLARFVLGG